MHKKKSCIGGTELWQTAQSGITLFADMHQEAYVSSSYCPRVHHKGGTESNDKRFSQGTHYLQTCIKKPIQVMSTYCLRVHHKQDTESNDKPCNHWPLYLDHISPASHALIIDAASHKLSLQNFKMVLPNTSVCLAIRILEILTHHVNNNTVHNFKQEPNCRRKRAWNVENSTHVQVFSSACRSVQHCFTSTETISTIWDRETRTATSTLTQLLSSANLNVLSISFLSFFVFLLEFVLRAWPYWFALHQWRAQRGWLAHHLFDIFAAHASLVYKWRHWFRLLPAQNVSGHVRILQVSNIDF